MFVQCLMFSKETLIIGVLLTCVMMIFSARTHPPTRKKIKEIFHGRVFWEEPLSNDTVRNTTMLRVPRSSEPIEMDLSEYVEKNGEEEESEQEIDVEYQQDSEEEVQEDSEQQVEEEQVEEVEEQSEQEIDVEYQQDSEEESEEKVEEESEEESEEKVEEESEEESEEKVEEESEEESEEDVEEDSEEQSEEEVEEESEEQSEEQSEEEVEEESEEQSEEQVEEESEEQVEENTKLTNTRKPIIAICAATRSKLNWRSLKDTALQTLLVPSIEKTVSLDDRSKYDFHLYLAADHDDVFWLANKNSVKAPSWLPVHIGFYEVPKHKIPFNPMMRAAYDDGAEYMVRVNDDSEFVTLDWVSKGVSKLASYNPPNVGMVGPNCLEGNTNIMTHDMVHRTHLDIFEHYYPDVFSHGGLMTGYRKYMAHCGLLKSWIGGSSTIRIGMASAMRYNTMRHSSWVVNWTRVRQRLRHGWNSRQQIRATLSQKHLMIWN